MRPRNREAGRLEEDYLARLRASLAGRDPGQAAEILQSVREHIDEAVAEYGSGEVTLVQMANVLERLGPPEAWARETQPIAEHSVQDRFPAAGSGEGYGAQHKQNTGVAWGRNWAIGGTVLNVVGIIVFLIGVRTMFTAMHEMKSGSSASPSPADVAKGMMHGGSAILIAGITQVTGVILTLVALWKIGYRASWFRTALWTLAVVWLAFAPVGTILGVIVILYLVKHAREFTASYDPASCDVAGARRP